MVIIMLIRGRVSERDGVSGTLIGRCMSITARIGHGILEKSFVIRVKAGVIARGN